MIELHFLIHYMITGLTIAIPVLGFAVGQSMTGRTMILALDEQPEAAPELKRIFFLGLIINETAIVLSALMSMFLLMSPLPTSLPIALAELGIFFAITIPSFLIGILSSKPLQTTITTVARQPLFAKKIMNLMIITLSIIQTSAILGLIVSLLIKNQLTSVVSMRDGVQLLASGLAIGLGSIGPLIGLAKFAQTACASVGYNRAIYQKVITFTFICQALIETPILFSLAVSLIILSSPSASALSLFFAALVIGLGTLGPGMNSGKVSSAACKALAENPAEYANLSKTSLIAQTLIDASAIYALIVALLFLFVAT